MNKSTLLWLLLLVAWIIFGLFLCKKYLCKCGIATSVAAVENEVVPVATSPKTNLGAWTFNDTDALSISADQHIRFLNSGATHLMPLSSDLNDDLKATATYLKAHADRTINVTGYYRADEKNNSILPNLGLARAADLQALLVSLGVSAKQITTDAKLLPNAAWLVNDTLYKGIDVAFNQTAATNNRLPDIKQRLLGKPIILYFETNKDNIELTDQQRTDFADLTYYLDNVATSKLEISGHTDNSGKRDLNVNLSKERAAFASSYLSKNGNIAANRMTVNGFGSDKPIAPNTDAAGKAKNRRVEVVLK